MFSFRRLCGKFNNAKEKGSQLREPFKCIVDCHKVAVGIFFELRVQVLIPLLMEFVVAYRAMQSAMFQLSRESVSDKIDVMKLQALAVADYTADITSRINLYQSCFYFLRTASEIPIVCLTFVLGFYPPNLAFPILLHNITSKVAVGQISLTTC